MTSPLVETKLHIPTSTPSSGVNSRRAAVRQAAELNLLSRTRDR
jgi:hypothetical protein